MAYKRIVVIIEEVSLYVFRTIINKDRRGMIFVNSSADRNFSIRINRIFNLYCRSPTFDNILEAPSDGTITSKLYEMDYPSLPPRCPSNYFVIKYIIIGSYKFIVKNCLSAFFVTKRWCTLGGFVYFGE